MKLGQFDGRYLTPPQLQHHRYQQHLPMQQMPIQSVHHQSQFIQNSARNINLPSDKRTRRAAIFAALRKAEGIQDESEQGLH